MKRFALSLAAPLLFVACDRGPTEPSQLSPAATPTAIVLPACATRPAPDHVRALILAVMYLRGLTPDVQIAILTPLFDASKALAAHDNAGAVAALQRFVGLIGGKAAPAEPPPKGIAEEPVPAEEPPGKVPPIKLPSTVQEPLLAAANCLIAVLIGL